MPKKKVKVKLFLSKQEVKRINKLLQKYGQPYRETAFQYGTGIKIPRTYMYE